MKTIKIYVSLPITGKESTVMERYLTAKGRIELIFGAANTKDYKLVHQLQLALTALEIENKIVV